MALDEFISQAEQVFCSSVNDIQKQLKQDFFNQIPACCRVENEVLINEILVKKQITLENISKLKSRLTLPKRLEKRLRKLTAISKPDLKEARQSIEILKDRFGDTVKIYSDVITYITEPIVLEGAELGRFSLRFTLDVLSSAIVDRISNVQAMALDPNVKQGHSHPHIDSGGRVCFGDAQNALAMAAVSLDIAAYFEILEAVLSTYNPESPYVGIEEWIGYTCDDCGQSEVQECYTCVSCEEGTLCSDCALYCDECHEYYCMNCYTEGVDLEYLKCPECGRRQCKCCCENESAQCEDCGRYMCGDCIVFSCDECEGMFCAECSRDALHCRDCEKSFCPECARSHSCEEGENK
jgi:hypothetical protein